jgi:t-SNARE complex subunit (syntaxin)
LWDNNLGKINAFFKNTQESWDNKIKEWTDDLEKRQIETKEQWDARKQKINLDINNWHSQTKRDWEKGLRSFRREMIKGSYMFLVYMIPILVVFVIIMYYVTQFLPK